jgi:Tol biopolymer transport system component
MKRRLILLVIIITVWAAVGCGGQPSPTSTDTPTIIHPTDIPKPTEVPPAPTRTEGRPAWLPIPPDKLTIIQLTDNPGWRESWPIWSPDGSQILFLSNRDCAIKQEEEGWETSWLCEKDEIYLMDADGNNQIRLTDTQSDANLFVDIPTWSPDGERIAVSFHYYHERYLQRVFTFSVGQIGQAPLGMDDMDVMVDEGEEFIVSRFRWSPNGEKYAYDYYKYFEAPPERWDIVIIDIESGEEVFRKTTTDDTICFFEEWSQNSEGILIMCDVDFGVEFKDDIYWIDVDGKTEKLLIENATDPIWSPDGKWILYYSRETGQRELFHLDSGEIIPFTNPNYDLGGYEWSWSPDGKWLAFSRLVETDVAKWDIFVLDMSWLDMEWEK